MLTKIIYCRNRIRITFLSRLSKNVDESVKKTWFLNSTHVRELMPNLESQGLTCVEKT